MLSVQKTPTILVACTILAAAPFLSTPSADITYHDAQRIAELFLLTACCVWVLARYGCARRPLALDIWSRAAVLVFFALGAVSALLSFAPRLALFEWSSFLLLGTLAFAIAEEVCLDPYRQLTTVLYLLGFGVALYLFRELLLYLTFLLLHIQPSPNELIFGFDNIRFFNHIQTISLPLLILLAAWNSADNRRWPYFVAFLIASLWWALLFLSAGRGTLLGIVAGGISTAWYLRSRGKQWYRELIKTCCAGLGFYIAICYLIPLCVGLRPFGLFSTVLARTTTNLTSGRMELWWRAVELICSHPLLGAGPLHFAHYAVDVQAGAHPHSWTLQIGAEWGLPALICFSFVVLNGLRCLAIAGKRSATDSRRDCAWAALLATGIAILVDGLVSGSLVMPAAQLAVALYCGCAWGWCSAFTLGGNSSSAKPYVSAGVCAVLAVAMACLWIGVWPQLKDLSSYEEAEIDTGSYQHGVLRPRVWSTGYF
jgi:hypothetical protein